MTLIEIYWHIFFCHEGHPIVMADFFLVTLTIPLIYRSSQMDLL